MGVVGLSTGQKTTSTDSESRHHQCFCASNVNACPYSAPWNFAINGPLVSIQVPWESPLALDTSALLPSGWLLGTAGICSCHWPWHSGWHLPLFGSELCEDVWHRVRRHGGQQTDGVAKLLGPVNAIGKLLFTIKSVLVIGWSFDPGFWCNFRSWQPDFSRSSSFPSFLRFPPFLLLLPPRSALW